MFWGDDEDERRRREEEERRKRDQEDQLRRRREEEAKKSREAADAQRRAKEAKKQQVAAKRKKAEAQAELDSAIGDMMEGFGSDRPGYDKQQKTPKESNQLGRGVLDSIFGAGNGSGFQNRPNAAPMGAPGQPIIGPNREARKQDEKKPAETFSSSNSNFPKLPRPF